MSDARRMLTFEPKTQYQRRDRDTAVAWITAQQPDRMFDCPNVTAAVQRGLRDAGFKIDQALIKRSMDNLVKGGYAMAEVRGRRTTLFLLEPDVDVPEPTFVVAKRLRADHAAAVEAVGAHPAADPVAPPGPALAARQVPLPARTPPVPLVFAELGQAVLDWWRDEPGPAEVWATAALEAIRA